MARDEDARLRFPGEFKDFLEEKKERPNQPNIEVLADENVLKEIRERFKQEEDKEEDDLQEFGSTLNLEL